MQEVSGKYVGLALCSLRHDYVEGCTEFASDCELDNTESSKFHLNLGFEEENRIIALKR